MACENRQKTKANKTALLDDSVGLEVVGDGGWEWGRKKTGEA